MGLIFLVEWHQSIEFHSSTFNCVLLYVMQRLGTVCRLLADYIMSERLKLQGKSLLLLPGMMHRQLLRAGGQRLQNYY